MGSWVSQQKALYLNKTWENLPEILNYTIKSNKAILNILLLSNVLQYKQIYASNATTTPRKKLLDTCEFRSGNCEK